ncbi:hypothetical protein [Limosilactobacillus gastricus]|uniref:hypothetical protein n=1 Tax=Limosilactobacillus gastricus TaxID=227942 RepID=UPI0002ED372B|nr:hypothetical protein [Limosilactobacillus gastricus]
MNLPKRIEIDIKELHFLTNNPRTEEAIDDFDAVKKLYLSDTRKGDNLIHLALGIAEEGFDQNEPIYAVKKDGKYIVYEGNRRLSALKMLTNPEKYIFLSEKHLKMLFGTDKQRVPSSIEVTVVNEDEAKKIMERNHGGALDGKGRIPWSPESSRRYARLLGKSGAFVDKTTDAFEETYGTSIGDYIGGITTADRIFGNKEIKKFIGKIEENGPDPHQLKKIKTILDRAKDTADEKKVGITRAIYNKRDIENLIPRERSNDINFNDNDLLRYINGRNLVSSDSNFEFLNNLLEVFNEF